ncbi:MAG TPA: hypothetical protein VMR95_01115 [Candidatus Binatia bacterium]|nr:hypothetical protein [Candidatus Binatia bacterium]
MTYLPPFGAGHINASIGGNSTSAGAGYALVSSGTMLLAGGNNVTLSQNGNTVTISAGAGAVGSNTFGMSNLSNTSGTTGVISGSALQFALAGGNNVTLSQSINASSATITISAANQTVQTQNMHDLQIASNTTGTTALVSSGTLSLAGGNNITLSQAGGNAITISGANQSNPNISMYATGNTVGSSSSQLNASSLLFNGLGAATVGYSNGSVEISVPTQTAQPGIQSIQASNTTYTTGNVILSNANGLSFGSSAGGAITASYTVPSTAGLISAINVSASNTSTNLSNLVFSNGGGISFGLNGSTITASDLAQAFSAGGGSSTFQTMFFANSNGLSFTNTGGSVAASYTVPSTAGLISAINVSASNTSTNISNLVFSNSNGVSFGLNGSTITASAVGGGGGGIAALANSQTSYNSGTINLIEGGGAITIASSTNPGQSYLVSVPQTSSLMATGIVSVATNVSTISIGAPAFSAGLSNLGNTSNTSATVTNQLIFAGGNNITLSQSTAVGGATITISGASQSVQSQNLFDMQIAGNTTGTSTIISSGTLSLYGGNNVTLSQTTAAGSYGVTISAASQTVQTQNLHDLQIIGNTTGTSALISSGTLNLSGGNNITLSASTAAGGNTIAISAASQSLQTQSIVRQVNIAGNTAGALATISSGTMTLAGSNNITLSQNGNAISIIGQPTKTLSRFEYPEDLFGALGTVGQGSLSFQHMLIPYNVTGTAMQIVGSLNPATSATALTGTVNMSLWMGLYTQTGNTLSLYTSGSANNSFSWQLNVTTNFTSLSGMRQLSVPVNVNITPGEYWAAAVISSASTNSGAGFTLFGGNQLVGSNGSAYFAPIGSSGSSNVMMSEGIYTAATAAGPASLSAGALNFTGASYLFSAQFYNAIYNANY